jgi:murein DD-endopeptidase MepM/ murein hydrolase activator NlpD
LCRGARIAVALTALALLGSAQANGQDSIPRLILRAEPPALLEGALGWIYTRPGPGVTIVAGDAAGEPIHFHAMAKDEFRALVGVPIESGDSLRVSLILQRGDRTDTVESSLAVRRVNYRREVLAVAPAFVRPDSAAAARIQSEIAKSREVSRESQDRPRLWRGGFRLPRASRITSPFGTARVFNGEIQSRHLGTDFAGAVGAPVAAAGRGVVALVADFYLAGRAIYIDHGEGLVTAYFHLSRADVRQGDTVAAGQRIGAVGRSGRVTGPHLHWVARYGTISVDPLSLLDLERSAAKTATERKRRSRQAGAAASSAHRR